MLYGRYEHNIDAKGRIFVPAKLREKLGDAFIAAAVMDHCVCLYSMGEWDKLQEGLAQMPMTYADLQKEALVIGAGNRAEIWNPAAYEDDIGAMTSDEVEAEFMELGF